MQVLKSVKIDYKMNNNFTYYKTIDYFPGIKITSCFFYKLIQDIKYLGIGQKFDNKEKRSKLHDL